jgi:thioesterase domain-containing protein
VSRARLRTLRAGPRTTPLFVVPGAGGAAEELADLARALPGEAPVIGLDLAAGREGANVTTAELAEAATRAVRRAWPRGPVCLLGYSFGGLVALDMAERLRAEGREVAFVGLVDTIFDRRDWPLPTLLLASARRAAVHAAAALRKPPAEAWRELRGRARRLSARLQRKGFAAEAANADRPMPALHAAMGTWRPRPVEGAVWFFSAARDQDFGCDPATLWRPWVEDLRKRQIAASHLSLVRDPASVAALAHEIGKAVQASLAARPRALVCAAFNWLAPARLASALRREGFAVEAICPPRSPLRRMPWLERAHPLDPWRLREGLAAAVGEARPDLIVPCDDRCAAALHAIHEGADPETAAGAALRRRIARSLGDPRSFPVLYSRAGFLALAAEAGVATPPTARVRDADDLRPWLARGPAVLKVDGTQGGVGVQMLARDADPALALQRLRYAPGLLKQIKRALVDGDVAGLRGRLTGEPPRLSVQAFVEGRPANAAAACLDGAVLGMVVVEAERTAGATGPATVVRILRHPGIERAVTILADALGLCGLCGFDFMLQADGTAQLIEINPRATPTAHLTGADGSNLAAELAAAFGRRPAPAPGAGVEGELVALFPQEMRRDADSPYFSVARHDVPWDEPRLVEVGLAQAAAGTLWPRARRAKTAARFALAARAEAPEGQAG